MLSYISEPRALATKNRSFQTINPLAGCWVLWRLQYLYLCQCCCSPWLRGPRDAETVSTSGPLPTDQTQDLGGCLEKAIKIKKNIFQIKFTPRYLSNCLKHHKCHNFIPWTSLVTWRFFFSSASKKSSALLLAVRGTSPTRPDPRAQPPRSEASEAPRGSTCSPLEG